MSLRLLISKMSKAKPNIPGKMSVMIKMCQCFKSALEHSLAHMSPWVMAVLIIVLITVTTPLLLPLQ